MEVRKLNRNGFGMEVRKLNRNGFGVVEIAAWIIVSVLVVKIVSFTIIGFSVIGNKKLNLTEYSRIHLNLGHGGGM